MLKIAFKHGHIPALDGLRGIAICLVVMFHCIKTETPQLNYIVQLGWTGVDLFFALSGFLITGILLETKDSPRYLVNFLTKRSLRIFPLYYFFLIVFFVAARFAPLNGTEYYGHNQAYFWTYTQNWLFGLQGWPKFTYLTHFWSLAIEEQFYIFWPLIVYFLNEKRLAIVCGLMIMTALIVRNVYTEGPMFYVLTPARIDTLCFGALTAIAIRNWPRLLDILVPPVFILATISVALICFNSMTLSFNNPHFFRYGYDLFALIFVSIICLVFDTGIAGRITSSVLSIAPLRFLGRYSYGIYVYHWPFYFIFYDYLPDYLGGWGRTVVFLAGVILTSMASYHLLEKRFLLLKDRIFSPAPSPGLQNNQSGVKNWPKSTA